MARTRIRCRTAVAVPREPSTTCSRSVAASVLRTFWLNRVNCVDHDETDSISRMWPYLEMDRPTLKAMMLLFVERGMRGNPPYDLVRRGTL